MKCSIRCIRWLNHCGSLCRDTIVPQMDGGHAVCAARKSIPRNWLRVDPATAVQAQFILLESEGWDNAIGAMEELID